MVKHLIGESSRKQLKVRSGSGRGTGRESWTRYFIEGPCRPHEHWPNQRARIQGHTNCRLVTQLCSERSGGGDLVEGPFVGRKLWLNAGRQFGPGLGRRQDLRCKLSKLSASSLWGNSPLWSRVVAFHFCNHSNLSLREFQKKNRRGAYVWEPDHLPIHGVPQHLRHRYCLTNFLEIVTRETNQDRRTAERNGLNPYGRSR